MALALRGKKHRSWAIYRKACMQGCRLLMSKTSSELKSHWIHHRSQLVSVFTLTWVILDKTLAGTKEWDNCKRRTKPVALQLLRLTETFKIKLLTQHRQPKSRHTWDVWHILQTVCWMLSRSIQVSDRPQLHLQMPVRAPKIRAWSKRKFSRGYFSKWVNNSVTILQRSKSSLLCSRIILETASRWSQMTLTKLRLSSSRDWATQARILR